MSGIKGAAELHWVQPFGLVDNDASDPMRIAGLQAKGVIALNVYSVESIYYHPTVQKLAGEKLAELLGGVVEENLRNAHADAMNAIRDSAKHLSTRIAEKAARALVFSLLPKKGEIDVDISAPRSIGHRTGCDHDCRLGCQEAICFTIQVSSVRFLSSSRGTDQAFRRYHAVDGSRVSRIDGKRFDGVEGNVISVSHPPSVAERRVENGQGGVVSI